MDKVSHMDRPADKNRVKFVPLTQIFTLNDLTADGKKIFSLHKMSKNVKRAREADESIGDEIKKVSFCLSLYSLNPRVSFTFPNFSSTFLLTPSQKAMAELVDEDGNRISFLPSDGSEERI